MTGNNKKNNVLNFTLSIRFDYFNLYIWFQVFNGCLLPLFSICLLICINDNQFMEESPQKGWSNCILIVCVIITLFLTASTIIQNAFGWTVTMQYTTISTLQLCNFIISGLCSIFTMYMLLHLTDLGDNVRKSFLIFFKREEAVNMELVNYTTEMVIGD